ncbi:hypothetical protein ACJMK2_039272 [Sinanodonta woodiana]|uniref:VWFA domain-containing protein n=1 Tax=Sinanodonta woodiana TaxID=1069815 RepID=A0ABD3WBI8_SINWO
MAGLQTSEDESGVGDEEWSDEIFVPAINSDRKPIMRREAQEKELEMLSLRVKEMNTNFKMITKRFHSVQGPTASRNTDEELMPHNVLSRRGEIGTRMKQGKCLSFDNKEHYDNISVLVDTINKFATRIDKLDHRLGTGNLRLCSRPCCHEHFKGGSGSKSCINIQKLDGGYNVFEINPSNQGTHEKIKGAVSNDPRVTKSDSKIVDVCELLPIEEPHGSEKQNLHTSSIDKFAGKPKTDDEKKTFIPINSKGLKSMKTDPQEDNRQKRTEDEVTESERHSSVNDGRKTNTMNAQSNGDSNFTNIKNFTTTVRLADKDRGKTDKRTRSENNVSGAAKTLTKTNESSMVPTYLPIEYWDSVCQETHDKALQTKRSRLIGFDTIICLDTSASVTEYWKDILNFLQNLIKDIEKAQPMEGGIREHIALVTYGHQTAVLQHFTTKYQDVLTQIHTIDPDGSTPMYWAVILCKVLLFGSAYAPILRGLRFAPRIILITDGRPSNRLLIGGLDESPKYDEEMVIY